jgi:shikimate kinase
MNGFGGKVKARRLAQAGERVKMLVGDRSIVLVGLMGCGKSSVGRRLAQAIGIQFVDADDEIELAAGQTIPEVFAQYGEDHFRDREARIISRILESGPQVLATGGGAYMRAETRERIRKRGISIWLKAELPVLMNRVMKRTDRPLLHTPDPEKTMRELMKIRYPVYAEADITVHSRDVPHDAMVAEILSELAEFLGGAQDPDDAAQNRLPSAK